MYVVVVGYIFISSDTDGLELLLCRCSGCVHRPKLTICMETGAGWAGLGWAGLVTGDMEPGP